VKDWLVWPHVNNQGVIHPGHTDGLAADKSAHQGLAELYTGFRHLLLLLVFINEE